MSWVSSDSSPDADNRRLSAPTTAPISLTQTKSFSFASRTGIKKFSLLAHRRIKWKFDPAGAPHHGGSWKRMVRSCKQVLYVILGSRRLTDEVLQTSLCLTEQFLNARPLTSVSNDPTEIEALTSNHFLLGGPCSSFLSLDSCDINHRKRYARAQAYADSIWSRWLREYTLSLNKRSKWYSPSDRELKVNDLVWIVDAQNPRGYYPLGRILSLKYGIDGIARSASEPKRVPTIVLLLS